MIKHGIEPMVNNKRRRKQTTDRDVFEKYSSLDKNEDAIPEIFLNKQKEFLQKLLNLEFDRSMALKIIADGIPAPDINLIIEITNLMKNSKKEFDQFEVMQNVEVPKTDLLRWRARESIHDVQMVPSPVVKSKETPKIKQRKYNINQKHSSEYEKPKNRPQHYEMDRLFSVSNAANGDTPSLSPQIGQESAPTEQDRRKFDQKTDSSNIQSIPQRRKKRKYTFFEKKVGDYLNFLSPNKTNVSSDRALCLLCNTNPISIVNTHHLNF